MTGPQSKEMLCRCEILRRTFLADGAGGAGYKRRMQEIQLMEERAAALAKQADEAEGLEGTVDDVVARHGPQC